MIVLMVYDYMMKICLFIIYFIIDRLYDNIMLKKIIMKLIDMDDIILQKVLQDDNDRKTVFYKMMYVNENEKQRNNMMI